MKRILKQKVCKGCGDEFTPYSSLSKTCSVTCAINYTYGKADDKLKRDIRTAEKVKRQDIRKRKEKLKVNLTT